MTRVLMLAPTPFFSDRGCHVRIYEEARALGAAGCEVELITYPIGSDPDGLSIRRVKSLRGYGRAEAGPAWPRLILDYRVLCAAWKFCAEKRPGVIHAHLHEGCLIGMALKARFKIPLVFDYQGSLTGESVDHGFIREGSLMARLFRAVESFIDRGADAVIASAASLRPAAQAVAVPDAVDAERFSPAPPDPALRAKLGLDPQTPVAVFLGVMSEYQGADLAIEAARILKDRGTIVRFLMMGYPEERFRDLAREKELPEIIFTGRLDYFESHKYLRLGSIAIAPKLSRTESNGKVLNYMACGLPVIAFDTPVNRELMADCAWYLLPENERSKNAELIADAIVSLLADPARARALGEKGRARAETMSFDKQARAIHDIYRAATEKTS